MHGLVILDVGNGIKHGSPEHPQLVSQLRVNHNELYGDGWLAGTHTVFRYKNYVYIGDEVYPAEFDLAAHLRIPVRGIVQVVDVSDIEHPRMVSDAERLQWFSNLAWCMFTEDEMKSGLAWQAIRPQLFGHYLDDAELDSVAGVTMRPTKALLKKTGQWRKDWKKVKTKDEQRRLRPFSKKRVKETPEEMW